jgi:hypothetical protein
MADIFTNSTIDERVLYQTAFVDSTRWDMPQKRVSLVGHGCFPGQRTAAIGIADVRLIISQNQCFSQLNC